MNILKDCMYESDKIGDDFVFIDVIMHKFVFKKEKLDKNKNDIIDMLEQLPPQFKQGLSFLIACDDKDGDQWEEHVNMEALVVLVIAIGKVSI